MQIYKCILVSQNLFRIILNKKNNKFVVKLNLLMTRNILSGLLTLLLISCISKTSTKETQQKKWWKEAIVYQIYPRSFKDSDGDGIGDLKGIIENLDYIQSLGVNTIWLNPIYESPNYDNGYDVSDYRAISKTFGTMEDFDLLLSEMHSRGIKLVMDVVVNHSSSEHPWFKASKSSRDNPNRDYYHWWPSEKGTPNYRYSLFDAKGDAWAYDETTDAYYLHYFAAEQPDLNWNNPKVQEEVVDIIEFWAQKGVDGFRLDAFQFASKDGTFPKFPEGFEKDFIQYYAMQDGIHDYLRLMNSEVFSKYNLMSVAEGAGRNFKEAHELVDADRNELSMAYAFDAVDLPSRADYSLGLLKSTFGKWDQQFSKKGWISIFLSNHDQARLVSRFANDSEQYRSQATKMLNTFLLSMRGTPYLYYGDELGMTNIYFDSIEQYDDIAAINGYKKHLNEGGDPKEYLEHLKKFSRDNGRTPMQWDSSDKGGFTTGTPWLTVNENTSFINVKAQNKNEQSVLNHFRTMTALRVNNLVLVYGDYKEIDPSNDQIYAFTRDYEGEEFLVLLNFSEKQASIELNEFSFEEVLINNYQTYTLKDKIASLKPYQALIVKLK